MYLSALTMKPQGFFIDFLLDKWPADISECRGVVFLAPAHFPDRGNEMNEWDLFQLEPFNLWSRALLQT